MMYFEYAISPDRQVSNGSTSWLHNVPHSQFQNRPLATNISVDIYS